MSIAAASMNALQSTRAVKAASGSISGLKSRSFNATSGIFRRSVKIQAVLTAETALDVAKMAPLGDRLLVQPKAQDEKSAGGVLLATSSSPRMEDAHIGTVVAIGDEVDGGVAVGDLVLFTKYGSSDIEVPGGEVCFVAQKSILAKLS